MLETHNKARHSRTASCAGLAHSSLACACGRYESYMKIITSIVILMSSVLASAADYDQIYEGKYYWGPEVNSFTLCTGSPSYWVSFNWAGIEMQNFYKKKRKEPYQGMYLKFRGHLLDEEVDGFAGSYDGLIHISEVKEYSFEIPESCK